MTRLGFKRIKIATNIPHKKRLWLIRHLITLGTTIEGLKEMGATDEEIKEAVQE